ncbi:hypothetical protein ACVW0P_000681 [Mucilaginibacter sp. UYNi724]
MNITEAKQISIAYIVEHLGGTYSHTDRTGNLWYLSPFRPEEKTASFKIDTKANKWHDFGQPGVFTNSGTNTKSSGGDILDLWCDYYNKDRRTSLHEALKELEQLKQGGFHGRSLHQVQRKEKPFVQNQQTRFKILKISDRITHFGLKEELVRRRISFELASLYLKQGEVMDNETKKKYYGFLFGNDKCGYEFSVPNPHKDSSFKNCIGQKGITYFEPANEKDSADVFEGFFDFLSWLEIKKVKHPINHTFVLNSNSLAGEATTQIINKGKEIKYAFLFLDNDESGFQTTHAIALALEPHGFETASMEGFYKDFKDLNKYFSNHNH